MSEAKKINVKNHAEVLEAYRSGKNLRQIAALCGVADSRISQILMEHGISAWEGRKAARDKRDREILKDLDRGMKVAALAAKYGMSYGGMQYRVRLLGYYRKLVKTSAVGR